MGKKRLGELLVETGLLTEENLTRALTEQRLKRGKLGEVIVALGLATEDEIAQTLSVQLGIPFIDLTQTPVEPQAIDLITEKVARKHLILPVSIDQKDLHIAMADPLSFEAFEDVRFASGYTIKPAIATRTNILWGIEQHYHLGSSLDTIVKDIAEERFVEVVQERKEGDSKEAEDLRKKSEAAPIIRMVNLIVSEAVEKGASDIHVEPTRSELMIRNRVDGLLRKSLDLPKWVQGAVISRIKIMAKMDIAEKRLPQDGRIGVRVGAKTLDLRVSTMPTNYGEKVVIRILDSANSQIPLEAMGLTSEELLQLEGLIRRPQGIMLVTGPTGSGKTTTLYGILNRIKSVEQNITTIEDPVEYEITGINQVAIQEKIGMTFASTLRSMLRQDPDIIMLGEMRDLETVTIAMQAALTGHFVLSTIHTNSCTATITRLRNLGAASYLIASTINCIMAQRLVRVICTKCRVPYDPPEHDLAKIGFHRKKGKVEFTFYRGEGCTACEGTGYKGRIGIYEILPFTQPIRDLVVTNASESILRQQAIASGMLTLARGALEKVQAGVTTLSELFRVVETEEDFGTICPECNGILGADFVMCPHCGHSLLATCPGCQKTVSPEWKFCPYCRHDFVKPATGRSFA
ncbi:MAG: Flp pilus assembly complex ATPase component TadA [Deltaproteobacteria bacterium]|nr:Flp pilus assembly complex ATPase component TadA [Deltaproteobacteria bacterium]